MTFLIVFILGVCLGFVLGSVKVKRDKHTDSIKFWWRE